MVLGGIRAAYGKEQQFDVKLSYFLDNPTVTSKNMELAIPPDTAFQKVSIQSLDPKPKTVLTDTDGNWLAQYTLAPSQKITVQATVTIRLTLQPSDSFERTTIDPALYTSSQKYWETTDGKIQELAALYNNPKDIYDYVVRTLSYDYSRVSQSPIRKGAVQALANPNTAICMEFTDVFIAIAGCGYSCS
jgi:hypothetical protein